MNKIGAVLKQLRKNKKLTQKELAERLSLPISTLVQYENNKREPNFDGVLKICNYFNVSPDFLIKENHFNLKDIEKYETQNIICQQKEIINSTNMSLAKYKNLLDNIIKNNTDSKHILSLIDSLDKLFINIEIIFSNKNYTNKLNYAKIYDDEIYRNKQLSELELYLYAERKIKSFIAIIENDLNEVFNKNFKDFYPEYKKNFNKNFRSLELSRLLHEF